MVKMTLRQQQFEAGDKDQIQKTVTSVLDWVSAVDRGKRFGSLRATKIMQRQLDDVVAPAMEKLKLQFGSSRKWEWEKNNS